MISLPLLSKKQKNNNNKQGTHNTINDESTTSTSTTTTEENPPTTITPLKMKTTGEEEFPILSGIFDIDDEFTTSNTTEEEEEDEKSNSYYDYIDNEIFQNKESTIVFEENSLAPATICTDNPNNIIIKDLHFRFGYWYTIRQSFGWQ